MFGEEIPYDIEENNRTKAEKKALWEIAIGLQKTDRLEPSEYLLELAKENINGVKEKMNGKINMSILWKHKYSSVGKNQAILLLFRLRWLNDFWLDWVVIRAYRKSWKARVFLHGLWATI